MSDMNLKSAVYEYRGYTIESDGGHGFYKVANPRGESIGTCEGSYTARQMVDEHIAKVFGFWNLNCVMSPLQARAGRLITNAQAEEIIMCGGLAGMSFPPADQDSL